MVDVLQALPVLLVICGPPLVAGLTGRSVLGWLWVSLLAALAIYATLTEPENYDMAGFGLRLFGAATALATVALLAGSALRRTRGPRR